MFVLALATVAAQAQNPTNYSAAVLADGPIHFYRFRETAASQPAADEGTPGGNPGTYTGGVTPGRPTAPLNLDSAAVEVDGADGSFVDLGLFHPGDSITVEAWVNVAADASATFKAVAARWDGSYELDLNGNDEGNFVVRNELDAFGLVATPRLTRGQWHHLVGIFEGGTNRIYLDGVAGTSQEIGGVLQDISRNEIDRVLIGATRNGNFVWRGLIAGVAFYDKAMTPEQIRTHFESAFPDEAPELDIVRAVELSWTTIAPGYVLQVTTNLLQPTWEAVVEQPRIEQGRFKLCVPADGQRFYRLFKP
jgi:hypothetical protein